jgi:hypothetical protein
MTFFFFKNIFSFVKTSVSYLLSLFSKCAANQLITAVHFLLILNPVSSNRKMKRRAKNSTDSCDDNDSEETHTIKIRRVGTLSEGGKPTRVNKPKDNCKETLSSSSSECETDGDSTIFKAMFQQSELHDNNFNIAIYNI